MNALTKKSAVFALLVLSISSFANAGPGEIGSANYGGSILCDVPQTKTSYKITVEDHSIVDITVSKDGLQQRFVEESAVELQNMRADNMRAYGITEMPEDQIKDGDMVMAVDIGGDFKEGQINYFDPADFIARNSGNRQHILRFKALGALKPGVVNAIVDNSLTNCQVKSSSQN